MTRSRLQGVNERTVEALATDGDKGAVLGRVDVAPPQPQGLGNTKSGSAHEEEQHAVRFAEATEDPVDLLIGHRLRPWRQTLAGNNDPHLRCVESRQLELVGLREQSF